MEPVVVIAGPTASGKTRLAVELAKMIGGSVVSADSMQIYKYMDIGTAKPDEREMSGIKHYMISEIDPAENFSVAKYREMALNYIKKIADEGGRAVIAGGTGLYISSLAYNIDFAEAVGDNELREKLKREAHEKGSRHLHDRLREIDPEAAGRIHENDLKRIIRAIEVYVCTGTTISELARRSRSKPPQYRYILFGLSWDRRKLYERIEKRVDMMFEKGLVDEVRRLGEMGYGRKTTAMQGIGYKEVLKYLEGECTLEETKNIIKRESRRYAKRQMTWFRKMEEIKWLEVDESTDFKQLAKKIIEECIETYGIIL